MKNGCAAYAGTGAGRRGFCACVTGGRERGGNRRQADTTGTPGLEIARSRPLWVKNPAPSGQTGTPPRGLQRSRGTWRQYEPQPASANPGTDNRKCMPAARCGTLRGHGVCSRLNCAPRVTQACRTGRAAGANAAPRPCARHRQARRKRLAGATNTTLINFAAPAISTHHRSTSPSPGPRSAAAAPAGRSTIARVRPDSSAATGDEL